MPRQSYPESPKSGNDSGFILIAALWLLLLAGVITATILMQTRKQAEQGRDQLNAYQLRHILDSGIATVVAERQFNGPSSSWWRLPAQGSIKIDGIDVELRLSNEAYRVDLNRASLEALAALMPPSENLIAPEGPQTVGLVSAIQARRASGPPFYSAREIDLLVVDLQNQFRTEGQSTFQRNAPQVRTAQNIIDLVTVASGLDAPRVKDGGSGSVDPTTGDSVRIEACAEIGDIRRCKVEIGRFALQPVVGWQVVDGWTDPAG
jgi:hypothetical protein